MQAFATEIMLWGSRVGAVTWNPEQNYAFFEYDAAFLESKIQLAPLTMPLRREIFSFPELSFETFHGLPGMLADSLPDKFGSRLIDEWLVRTGRDPSSFSPVERLCYLGSRGMGALEFRPALRENLGGSMPLQIAELVELADAVLAKKQHLNTSFKNSSQEDTEAIRDILRVGTSAGGARAKAVIAWNEKTGEVRSGQVKAPAGFGYWLIKFDGVSENRDKELNDPKGFGKVEYVYSKMAREAGIEMSDCRLFHEHGRSHFMTRRFDRTSTGQKIFMQTLCGIAHMDFNQAGAYSYEQAMDVAQKLGLPKKALEQLFRRMVFNVLGRNQDDHTKNISFLMNKAGIWSLAPAYDLTYNYNPDGAWTHQHQMSINGKRDNFVPADFHAVSKRFNIATPAQTDLLIEEIEHALSQWKRLAREVKVPEKMIDQIACNCRIRSFS